MRMKDEPADIDPEVLADPAAGEVTAPQGAVDAEASGEPEALAAKMAEQLARRDESQPTRDRTAGSTFRNPAGYSSTGRDDDTHELKAWKVIDEAGLRGATLGGAVMNRKHPNFLTNAGEATAADLENLGEMVRDKVFQSRGIRLEWEIMRLGEPGPQGPVPPAFNED